MNSIIRIIVLFTIFLYSGCNTSSTEPNDNTPNLPDSETEFLSQTPPGSIPELFSPLVFTGDPELHSTIIFNQEGTELYYSPMDGPPSEIMYMTLENGRWSDPNQVPFTFDEGVGDPTLSPDGNRLYFISTHPVPGGVAGKEYIWYVEREGTEWGEPIPVESVLDNLYTHWNVSVDEEYNIYFTGKINQDDDEDIYYSEYNNGTYTPPVLLHENINTNQYSETTPYVAPDQSYLIFARTNTSGYADLYISFKMEDDIWSPTYDFEINTDLHELYPAITGNGNYLFFMSNRDGLSRAYWVSAEMVSDLQAEFESTYFYNKPTADIDGWETATLSEVSMNEELLTSLAQTITDGDIPEVHGIVIIKDGLLVFDEYWDGHLFNVNDLNYLGQMTTYNRYRRHNTHSATKSFTSAVVGIAIDLGYIENVNESIFNYMPDHQHLLNEENHDITIEDCLKMASGLEWNEWDLNITSSQNDLIIFNGSSDPASFLLRKPVITEPGESFYYNGATVDLLGIIVRNATGQSVPSFSSEHLFAPLGISNYAWQTLPSGITCCHGDIYITPRDMAKFGQLYLQDGQWNGEQIISSEWVRESTQFKISVEVNWTDGYGYLWWLKNFEVNGITYESFKAMGWGGQEIFVFKNLELVVAFTGANYRTNVPCDYIIENYILTAIQ